MEQLLWMTFTKVISAGEAEANIFGLLYTVSRDCLVSRLQHELPHRRTLGMKLRDWTYSIVLAHMNQARFQ